jgi:hypothetical protein
MFCIQSGREEKWPPKFVRHGQVYINLGNVSAECAHFPMHKSLSKRIQTSYDPRCIHLVTMSLFAMSLYIPSFVDILHGIDSHHYFCYSAGLDFGR